MELLRITLSTETCVIAFCVAMSLLAFIMHPKQKQAALTFFAKGEPSDAAGDEPSLEVETDREGRLHLRRVAIETPARDCTWAVAVKVAGTDITITEKSTADRLSSAGPATLDVEYFLSETLRRGKYHIRYESEVDGCWATGWLSVPTAVEKRMTLHR